MTAQQTAPYSSDAYKGALLASFPPGDVYSRNPLPSSVRGGFVAAIGDGLARAEAAAFGLVLNELDPRTATYMFPEWLELTGVTVQATYAQTVAAVMAHINELGSEAIQYFINLAAALGVTISIAEHSGLRCGMRCGSSLGGIAWDFTWDVVTDLNNYTPMRAGTGRCGDPLATWGNALLQQIIRRYSPAHTIVRFIYT